MLVSALVVSLPGIMQAAGVLLLVLMMYAITGVYLFRDVVYGQYLNKHANFENFTLAMITLFRYARRRGLDCCLCVGPGGSACVSAPGPMIQWNRGGFERCERVQSLLLENPRLDCMRHFIFSRRFLFLCLCVFQSAEQSRQSLHYSVPRASY